MSRKSHTLFSLCFITGIAPPLPSLFFLDCRRLQTPANLSLSGSTDFLFPADPHFCATYIHMVEVCSRFLLKHCSCRSSELCYSENDTSYPTHHITHKIYIYRTITLPLTRGVCLFRIFIIYILFPLLPRHFSGLLSGFRLV